jgi:hypothetical protein
MQKTTKTFFSLAFFFVVYHSVSAQRNLYVSPNGQSTNNGLSVSTPFLTIQQAHDSSRPGDIINIMPGTYNNAYSFGYGQHILAITKSGSLGNPIVYKPYDDNNRPVLKMNLYGSGTNTTVGWSAINIIGASYITIYHLNVVGANDNLDLAKGEEIYNYYQAEKSMNNGFLNTNWNYISTTNTTGIQIDREKLPSYDPTKTELENYDNFRNPHHITIDGCQVSKFAGAGINCQHGDYIVIAWNVVSDNCWYTIWANSGISIAQGVHFDDETGYKTFIRNNVVFGNKTLVKWEATREYSDGNGIIVDLNQSSITDNAGLQAIETYNGKTLIQNNICYNNGGSGIHSVSAINIDIIGNTAYKNGTRSENAGGSYANIFFCCSSPNNRVINNIIYAADGKKCTSPPGAGDDNSYYSNNIYFNDNTVSLGTNDITADPKFAGPFDDLSFWIGNSFKITQESPAYNRGIAGEWGDYPDIWLTSRPQNGKYDIGACEVSVITAVSNHGNNLKDVGLKITPTINNSSIFNITLNSSNSQEYSIEVIGASGQIYYQAMIKNNTIKPIDLSKQAKGVYFIRFKNGNNVITKKVIVN